MNIRDIRKIRDAAEYETALVELVNDYHERVGTPDDERPDVKAELQKAARTLQTDPSAIPPLSGIPGVV